MLLKCLVESLKFLHSFNNKDQTNPFKIKYEITYVLSKLHIHESTYVLSLSEFCSFLRQRKRPQISISYIFQLAVGQVIFLSFISPVNLMVISAIDIRIHCCSVYPTSFKRCLIVAFVSKWPSDLYIKFQRYLLNLPTFQNITPQERSQIVDFKVKLNR